MDVVLIMVDMVVDQYHPFHSDDLACNPLRMARLTFGQVNIEFEDVNLLIWLWVANQQDMVNFQRLIIMVNYQRCGYGP